MRDACRARESPPPPPPPLLKTAIPKGTCLLLGTLALTPLTPPLRPAQTGDTPATRKLCCYYDYSWLRPALSQLESRVDLCTQNTWCSHFGGRCRLSRNMAESKGEESVCILNRRRSRRVANSSVWNHKYLDRPHPRAAQHNRK